jgi:DNA-binding response OmpR family regulator
MDVLLVEDETALREVLVEDLADGGLDVLPCPSAEAGLEAGDRGARPPAVLVTDVDLGPGMDGVELVAEAQRRWPDVAVVIMTGDDRNLARMPETLRDACLMKPFPLSRLASAVHSLMRQA